MGGNYCLPKKLIVVEPYSDGSCPSVYDYEINSDGKCQRWEDDYDKKYPATVQRYCSTEGMLVDNDEKCAVEIGYSNFYERCPSGYDFATGKFCYKSSTKTSVVKKYACDYIIDGQNPILKGDKCYIKK